MDTATRPSRLRLHPFVMDVLSTGVAQALILAGNLVLVGVISKWMGVTVLGGYLLVKRVCSWLASGTQLGLNVALPRQIAHTADNVEIRARQYFVAAFAVAVSFVTIIGAALALNAELVARVCFGSNDRGLVYATALFLLGSSFQVMVFGYYRGLERVRMANLVSVAAWVIVPLVALAATRSSHSASSLVSATGLGIVVVCMIWAVPNIVAARDIRVHFLSDVRNLVSYGVARVPGDIAAGGLLALGPMLISHYVSIEQVSYLLLGITCLTMAGVAFAPVGIVLLARISRLLGVGRFEDVNVYVGHLRSAVLQISVVVVVQFLIFARPIVQWWLGPQAMGSVLVISILMLGVPAYMHFLAMRSVVDAASKTPYNAYNVVVALAVLAVLSALVVGFVPLKTMVVGEAIATTLATCVLAGMTDATLRRLRLVNRFPQMGLIATVPFLAAISLCAQAAFHFNISKIAFSVVLLVNLGLMLLLLRKSQPEWLGFVWRVALSRT